MHLLTKLLYFILMACLLVACQGLTPKPTADTAGQSPTKPTVDLQEEYRALSAAGGVVYEVDVATSSVRIYVFRGGSAAKLGHNHVISVPRLEGYVHLPSDDPGQARFDVRVPLAELVVDDPVLRAETGGNFSGERSTADIEGTRRNMLGARGFDVAQYPVMQLKSVAVSGDWPVLVADVAITLHGVTREQPVELQVQHSKTGLKVKGSMVLRQSAFGIRPYTILGGLVAVQDAVVVDFYLSGIPL